MEEGWGWGETNIIVFEYRSSHMYVVCANCLPKIPMIATM